MTWRYEVQHVATAISLVQAGVGLTVLPRLAIDLATAPELVGLPLRNPAITRTLGIVMKRGSPISPAGEVLKKLIETQMRRDN